MSMSTGYNQIASCKIPRISYGVNGQATMADIQAFRAYRYDLGHVGNLSTVVAPPYDVIDSEFQRRLIDSSPYNIVRADLNPEEPGDSEIENRYTRAAKFLNDWKRAGALAQDS